MPDTYISENGLFGKYFTREITTVVWSQWRWQEGIINNSGCFPIDPLIVIGIHALTILFNIKHFKKFPCVAKDYYLITFNLDRRLAWVV